MDWQQIFNLINCICPFAGPFPSYKFVSSDVHHVFSEKKIFMSSPACRRLRYARAATRRYNNFYVIPLLVHTDSARQGPLSFFLECQLCTFHETEFSPSSFSLSNSEAPIHFLHCQLLASLACAWPRIGRFNTVTDNSLSDSGHHSATEL